MVEGQANKENTEAKKETLIRWEAVGTDFEN